MVALFNRDDAAAGYFDKFSRRKRKNSVRRAGGGPDFLFPEQIFVYEGKQLG